MPLKMQPEFITDIAQHMVRITDEVESRREEVNQDDQYISYREGLYDAYTDVLLKLGYTNEDIWKLEKLARIQ
ncbi:hypothetical protein [Jeotgalibacillus malaysiensis]|uniref:hypothetical protein n=1 Tax=Jeotgalibacillus malaysiensis TaxID=1508404 RepID=UPI00384C9353